MVERELREGGRGGERARRSEGENSFKQPGSIPLDIYYLEIDRNRMSYSDVSILVLTGSRIDD